MERADDGQAWRFVRMVWRAGVFCDWTSQNISNAEGLSRSEYEWAVDLPSTVRPARELDNASNESLFPIPHGITSNKSEDVGQRMGPDKNRLKRANDDGTSVSVSA